MVERDEEFEHIPWAELAVEHRDARTRLVYGAAAVVVAVVIGVAGARLLVGPADGEAVSLPDVEPPSALVPTPDPVAPAPTTEEPPTLPAIAAEPFSEADLMAVAPEEEERLAAFQAESFVREYFTVDGSVTGGERVRALLPSGVEDIALPHESSTGDVSYVEWAGAHRVEATGPGRYTVTVSFVTLYRSEDDRFVRGPMRTVTVPVSLGADSFIVEDLPEIVSPPSRAADPGWPSLGADVPDDVAAAASDRASLFGTDATIVGGSAEDDGWRVVVWVTDASGVGFPVVVRV